MNFKYDINDLKKEVEILRNKKGFNIVSYNPNNKELDINLFSKEKSYSINFYLDTSINTNFFKKNFDISISKIIPKKALQEKIQFFYNSYPFQNKQTLSNFFESLQKYIEEDEELNNYFEKDSKHPQKKRNILEKKIINQKKIENNSIFLNTLLINILSIILKIITGLFGYSGENDPPKYGDCEAQRHWMELTINLPIKDWYTNSTLNPLSYWPIDYPPMSAYHSFIFGLFLNKIYPECVQLKTSWGFESNYHKKLMRFISLISDIFTFHFACNLFVKYIFIDSKIEKNYKKYYICLFIMLVSPSLIIIDHGHYQFNNVMHGFFIFAVYFLYKKKFIFAIIFYAMCINFKQMGMYYAIPFPIYVIRYLTKKDFVNNFISFLLYGIVTISSLCLIWSPWLFYQNYQNVLQRIFPIWRGIFEDKVATFWCVLNIFYKLSKLSQGLLIKCSLLLTVMSTIIPIICMLFGNNFSRKIFNLSFFIVSFGFYLFSFHVHEKTIIVPYLAYLLCFFKIKEILPSFNLIAMFSMYPMLKRENQIIPYFVLSFSFYIVIKIIISKYKNSEEVKKENNLRIFIFTLIEIISIIFIIGYHICEKIIPPPQKYPWFYPLINAVFSFTYFIFIFLIANIEILKLSFGQNNKKKKIE
jgi:alpha-1,3-glucosyltransferase